MRADAGFSLVETLVALVVAATAAAAIYGLTTQTARTVAAVREESRALAAAQAACAGVGLGGATPAASAGETAGVFWRVDVRAEPRPRLSGVALFEVRCSAAIGQRRRTLTTYRLAKSAAAAPAPGEVGREGLTR
jgi:prepilin-type N-terminal cleavage/methylation domain-containing protein